MTTAAYEELKNDYLDFDNVEEVTLTPDAEAGTEVEEVAAMFEPLPIRTHSAQVGMGDFSPNVEVAVIILFDATLQGQRPETGSKITFDNGDVWTINSKPRQMTWRTRWRCICIKDRA